MIQNMLENKENNEAINCLLRNALNLDIESTENPQVLELNNISEYDFSIVKAICKLTDNTEVEVYLRMMRTDKIKETIYCYWCFIYNEELKKYEDPPEIIISRVVISELERGGYKNGLLLKTKNPEIEIVKHGAELYFLNTLKYIDKIKSKSGELEDKLEKLKSYFDPNSDDVLFIGIKLNENIKRNYSKLFGSI